MKSAFVIFVAVFSLAAFADPIPQEVAVVATTFKLGDLDKSVLGRAPSGSTSADRFYFFKKGTVKTVMNKVERVTFNIDLAVDYLSAESLPMYIIKIAIQQSLGAYINSSMTPNSLGHISLHFENGDAWLNYRGRERTRDDEFIGMKLKDTIVPGRVLTDAAEENLGKFLKMEDGVFYFENGNI